MRFDPKQWELQQPYAPIGTLYAAALMRSLGHEVALFDTIFVTDPDEVLEEIEKHTPDIFVIYDDGFNYLTKMCLTNMRDAAFRMIRLVKEKKCTVIVSSSDSTDHYGQYLLTGADYVMMGEAEQTLTELVGSLETGSVNAASIEGIAYKENGQILRAPQRKVLKDLDSLPFPAWDLADMNRYKKAWLKSSGYFSINIGTTRGCPFKCNWCAKPIYGSRYNSRSPRNVVNEIKMLKERYEFDHVWFCDDIFGLKPGWVNEFARLVNEGQLQFQFKIQSRADLLLQENYVKGLAAAGCTNVWMGAESGSQKILDAMDKGITTGQIKEATLLLKKYGIRPSFFLQFGYIGETKEDIDQTIKMVNELLPSSIGISVSYPLKGTVFYEKVKSDLKEKANWTDSDELQLMFKNTYQPAFYKRLHRYVQQNHRKHLACDYIKQLFRKPTQLSPVVLKKIISIAYYVPSVFFQKIRLGLLEKQVVS